MFVIFHHAWPHTKRKKKKMGGGGGGGGLGIWSSTNLNFQWKHSPELASLSTVLGVREESEKKRVQNRKFIDPYPDMSMKHQKDSGYTYTRTVLVTTHSKAKHLHGKKHGTIQREDMKRKLNLKKKKEQVKLCLSQLQWKQKTNAKEWRKNREYKQQREKKYVQVTVQSIVWSD